MKNILLLTVFLFSAGCGLNHHYSVYQYDNGDDYISEGTQRIIDHKTHKMGYATPDGKVIIPPQYKFAYPFKNGKAKVTYSGNLSKVPHSGNEYHYWNSHHWFYIDKNGKKI